MCLGGFLTRNFTCKDRWQLPFLLCSTLMTICLSLLAVALFGSSEPPQVQDLGPEPDPCQACYAVKNYTSRDPKQLRTDGQAQTCQQLVAFCASTRMNQNDAVVNPARVALLHVCCWRASRFSTAQELRLGKRAVAGERARVNASVAAQARIQTHVCVCVCTWKTHMYTTETAHAARANVHP